MGSRFLLLFALARLLEPAEVGLFGLLLATVYFNMLLVGWDYYTYSHREMLALPRERWSFVLQHHALAIALLYACLLPLQVLLFSLGFLPREWFLWYMLLLVAEHLGQELTRLLVVMGRPLIASWILFLRTGAWVWVVVPLMWLTPGLQRVEVVLVAWLVGASLAIPVAVTVIIRDVAPLRRWGVDYKWLRRGFRVGTLFLFATLCFRALLTADRYVVAHLVSEELLGVYVLYVGIAMALVNFLDSAVFAFLYPALVAANRRGNREAYGRIMREMTWSAVGISVGLAVAAALLGPFVLGWVGREVYLEHVHLLWLLLAVAVGYAVGMIPHYGLYARGADRGIIVAHASSLPVFVFVIALLAPRVPFMAVGWGLLVAFAWMAGVKLVYYRYSLRVSSYTNELHGVPVTSTSYGAGSTPREWP